METAEKTIASTDEVGAVSMSPSTSLLASYLVRCELVFPEAVEDPEGFDGGLRWRGFTRLAACFSTAKKTYSLVMPTPRVRL
jgi:hypothetical protein